MTDICSIPIRSRRKAQQLRAALEATLKTFADPVARRLKVRTALKAGGICIQCGNHNRSVLG